jgi:thiaminase/transcriptional activator TenA
MSTAPKNLFETLRDNCADDWRAYVEHPFVAGMADGTLPKSAFRFYLEQDYLFLIHFARAYGLAAYKAETIEDIRGAAAGLSAIIDTEMALHVEFCAGWGLTEAQMAAVPEAPETMAYTRYVLEKGLQGDLLDLHVALAPCMLGYGEIGHALAHNHDTKIAGNPYVPWIEMYASKDYQDVAAEERATLDRLMKERGGPGRMASLTKTFAEATRLEAAFWDMGLRAAD